MIKTTTLFALLLFAIGHSQETLSSSKILNIAAKQRLLSQKMAKAKVCVVQNINAAAAAKELATSTTIFDESLKLLSTLKISASATSKINKIQAEFLSFKEELNNPAPSSMDKVVTSSADLLTECDNLVIDLKYFYATSPAGKSSNELVINDAVVAAGSMRYLSQQLALYNIYSYTKNDIDVSTQLIETNFKVEKAVSNLLTCEANNSEIDDQIALVYSEWNKIKAQTKTAKIEPSIMIEKCNTILSLADKLTNMYVDMLK